MTARTCRKPPPLHARSKQKTRLSRASNGLVYSAALRIDTKIVIDALQAGAIAAGLSGKGPAVTIVTTRKDLDQVKSALHRHTGEIIQSNLNHEKAKVIELG